MMYLVLGAAPFVCSVALHVGASSVARRCAPAVAARVLVVLGLCTALSAGMVLCAVACVGITQLPAFARLGNWSAASMQQQAPVPMPLAILTSVIAGGLITASFWQVGRSVHRMSAAAGRARALGPAAHGLSIVDDEAMAAYAIPSLPRSPGRTVVSRSLLRLLDPAERRALLAHEASHLRHRHVVYVQLAELSAAANPLLRNTASAVHAAVEQWADSDAVAALGDPVPVARALAKVALARAQADPTRSERSSVLLDLAAETEIAGRVRALTTPRSRTSRGLVALVAVTAVLCATGGSGVGIAAHAAFERAQTRFAELHR